MTNYNALYTPGDFENEFITTVIEISKGSMLKIEWNREKHTFELDRVEPEIFAKPSNYGFIPGTLDEDGDELDTLVIAPEALPTGLVIVSARILGVLNFEDDGEMDHKIICVPADDRDSGSQLHKLEQLGEQWKAKIEYHFNTYKDLKKRGTTKVLGFGTPEDAITIIKECVERYEKKPTT
ncbi:inorganic pyrophosphatase [Candidatus Kaiserbacteria bacterium CG10_big_fil_rev_8_21_14_0_10_45_20]|uniref:Inorganic pyrophosphatase n=1 Tax=Candidatus Kaiserbacteria bacterium CG10_big_fil_rev_8_21_14_0_10_45_20 TaxID=1974607 RepID=A0A2H0UFG6_9BACT|nr:MAG: inorganic pyrophosphatase [Candidatus Kaiserbacteria bacterium CG10_big_fil_rev_8_21_14_0_10_45_20]